MEDQSIGKWVSIMHRHFHLYLNRELKEKELSASEFLFLLHIPHETHVNQKYLTEKLSVDKALTVRAVKSLFQKGFIEREEDKNDKRVSLLKLSPKGKEALPFVKKKLENWTKILSEGISDSENKLLQKQLKKMALNAISKTKGVLNEHA